MAKRVRTAGGRRAKPGARTPSGRLSRAKEAASSGPTPEVAARRAFLAGADGDPDKTSNLIDLMATRGILDQDQWWVARRYAYCRNVVFGLPAAAASGARQFGREITEGTLEEIEAHYWAMAEALGHGPIGRGSRKRAVDEVLIYDRWPRWFRAFMGLAPWRGPEERQKERFVDAISAMAQALERCQAQRRRDRERGEEMAA